MLKWLVTKRDVCITALSGSHSPDFTIDLLKAVCFVYGAWYEIKQATISNCLKKGFASQDNSGSQASNEKRTETTAVSKLWDSATPEEDMNGAKLFDRSQFCCLL